MFEAMLWMAAGLSIVSALVALDGSRDVFHPLVFIAPMFAFLYAWIPLRLHAVDGLSRYFDSSQLLFIQTFYLCGILAFVLACLSVGLRVRKAAAAVPAKLSAEMLRRLLVGGAIAGSLGLLCWMITIHNVGGFVAAFSGSYKGGWDDSGYVRDGSLLLLVGVLLSVSALASGAPRVRSLVQAGVFGLPWLAQSVLMARRGPTFAVVMITLLAWYMTRRQRPPLVAMAALGFLMGWLVLFLVTNRGSIYLGSDFNNVSTDVGSIVDTPDTGNEYIYGGGAILSAERANHYFWMRRYLAQIMVRPIPRAIWPTKYEDFGVPELLKNAGTGEGFGDAMGWEGADGSAPGIIADLWLELWWLAVPAMAGLGWLYGYTWKKSVTQGGAWTAQYAILAALSIYLVMQTMEAVIFRTLLLSIPCWLTWRWALRAPRLRQPARAETTSLGSVQRA